MKITTNRKKFAADVLAGMTQYDEVEYRGVLFRRSLAVHDAGKDGDISIAAARRYVDCMLDRIDYLP